MDRDNLIYDMYRRRIESGYGGIPGPRSGGVLTGGKYATGDGMFSDVARDIAKKVATIALDDREGLDRLLRGLKGGVYNRYHAFLDEHKHVSGKEKKKLYADLDKQDMEYYTKKALEHRKPKKPRTMNAGLKAYQTFVKNAMEEGYSLKDARCLYYDAAGKVPPNKKTQRFCEKTAARRLKPKKELSEGLKAYQEFMRKAKEEGIEPKVAKCMYYEATGKEARGKTKRFCDQRNVKPVELLTPLEEVKKLVE